MYSYGPPRRAEKKQDDQLEHTYSSSVRIRNVTLKTCQRRWTIGRSGERGSGISVLVARSRDELIRDVLLWTPTYSREKAGQSVRTYIQQFCEDKECNPEGLPECRWTIGRSGDRGSGISVLVARSRDELIRDVLLWTPTYSREKAGQPVRTYIQRFCEDKECSPEGLPVAMDDREKWWERVRDICASGTKQGRAHTWCTPMDPHI